MKQPLKSKRYFKTGIRMVAVYFVSWNQVVAAVINFQHKRLPNFGDVYRYVRLRPHNQMKAAQSSEGRTIKWKRRPNEGSTIK